MDSQYGLISFLVPAYNTESTILDTLDSIVKLDTHLPFQIIVIDDGSTDQTVSHVRKWIQNTSLSDRISIEVIQQKYAGEAEAMNTGFRAAKGGIIAWIESDVLVHADWLSLLLTELENADVVGAGGVLLPAADDGWLAQVMGYEIAFKMKLDSNPVKHITSANALYKAEIFETLGNCKAELGASSFDSEMNHRITSNGYKLHRNQNALAWHHFKSTLWGIMQRSFWYGFRRPFVQSQVLYRADTLAGSLVLLALFGWGLLPFVYGFPNLVIAYFLGLLGLHLVYGWILFCYFPYPPLLSSGVLFLLRNIIFSAAYVLGVFTKYVNRSA